MPKRTKTFVENELNEIFKLIVRGVPDSDIYKSRNLPVRTYQQYRDRLEDRLVAVHMNQKTEQILFHKEITKERIMKDKRIFEQVMDDESTRPHTKVEAARADMEANVVLFKLENETVMFVNTIRKQQTDVLRLDAVSARLQPISSEVIPTTTTS